MSRFIDHLFTYCLFTIYRVDPPYSDGIIIFVCIILISIAVQSRALRYAFLRGGDDIAVVAGVLLCTAAVWAWLVDGLWLFESECTQLGDA